ncbi:MAG: nucleotide-binding protein [Planctomycetaceae bacterium]|nr:nucleotide-binding protein [Planctomycetaceae bacterium]
MQYLAKHFSVFGVDLTYTDSFEEFFAKYHGGSWDFVVTDLFKKDSPVKGRDDPKTGTDIARALSKALPVYVITQHFNLVEPGKQGIPAEVVIKSKSTDPAWMASEIVDDLRRKGVFVDRRRVFLAYGHSRGWGGLRGQIEDFLRRQHLDVISVSEGNLQGELLDGLLRKMQDCSAFVALCTPDDCVESSDGKRYQPRANVLLEAGMVLGLPRGLQRLVLLQGWKADPTYQAHLPSDLGGVMTIRMSGEFHEHSDKLLERLKELRVDTSVPADC